MNVWNGQLDEVGRCDDYFYLIPHSPNNKLITTTGAYNSLYHAIYMKHNSGSEDELIQTQLSHLLRYSTRLPCMTLTGSGHQNQANATITDNYDKLPAAEAAYREPACIRGLSAQSPPPLQYSVPEPGGCSITMLPSSRGSLQIT